MPLTMVSPGAENIIQKIGGPPEIRHRLESLGFAVGGSVRLISTLNGSVIVVVKDARIAVSEEMARKILVTQASSGKMPR